MSNNQYDDDTVITPAEAGRIFGVDPKTITRWAQAGKLPATRTLGGHRRYKLSDVRALLNGGYEANVAAKAADKAAAEVEDSK